MAQSQRPPENISVIKPPKPKPPPPVCFSFAAYSKTLIRHLHSLNVDVSSGLTDGEISAVESSLDFSFPPDLRSILQAGLPVGTHFPDWRTESTRHLRVLLNLPLLHLSKSVVRNGFWVGCWGSRPKSDVAALSIVKKLTEHAPVLVPVYGNFYVPSTTPNLAGNPVLQIDGDGVSVLSVDVAGFFQRFDDLLQMGFGFASSIYDRRNSSGSRILPGWAAIEVRRVEFWTDVAERRKRMAARETPRGWWSASPNQCLRARLDDAFWTLRDGGWREDEVRDMLNGHDSSQALSPAGWYREDVAYTIGRKSRDCDASRNRSDSVVDRNLCTETRQFLSTSCCVDEEVHQKKCGEITTLMYLLSLEA